MSQLSIKNKFISTVRAYPLASFFILAYLGSWIGWGPWWLSQTGVGLLPYELPHSAVAGINQLGLIAGPLVAVFVVTRIASGRKGVKQLQKSFTQWRVHPLAYILAFVAIPLAICAAYFLFGGVGISSDISPAIITTLLVTFVTYLAGGPLQEEGGWRGFALHRLQQRYHPLVAAVILGIVHCLWHIPLFFTSEWDTARSGVSQLWAYLVLVVSMSVVMSWLVNKARGSVFLAILAHNSVNWSLFVVATLSGVAVANNWPAALGLTALAIVAIVATRGRLAFERSNK